MQKGADVRNVLVVRLNFPTAGRRLFHVRRSAFEM